MKILYAANIRIPTEKAHGFQILKMCEAFADSGVPVELVIPNRINDAYKNVDPFVHYKVKNNFKIKKLFIVDLYHWLIKFPQGTYIKFELVSFIFSLFLHLLFKKGKKNYIFYTRDYYLLPILRLFSKKVIWEAHDLPRRTNKYINIFKSCFKIITITEYLKNTLMDFGVDSGKILTCPDGVDLSEFDIQLNQNECREKLNLPLDKNIILYTGHLYPWKGVYILAEASQLLSKGEIVVFVGGTDFDRQNFDKYIFEKNIKQDFLIVPHQPHTEIPFWLKAADVLVLPNSAKKDISKYYTSPLKLFEYMAAKKPIVASDLPSIRSILNNANALLVEPDSPSVIANGIRKLIGNKQFSDGLAERSNQDVLQYTWANRVKNIISFIKN